jgi:hypothetical protein
MAGQLEADQRRQCTGLAEFGGLFGIDAHTVQ